MKLQKTVVTSLMLFSVGTAFCQSVGELEKKHQDSIATPEGKAYESLATSEIWSDLSFLPKCASKTGIYTGAITIYYEVNSVGEISNLHMTPDTVLAKCIRPHIISRKLTSPSKKWVGKIILTISR